jgi:hypothetical protein
MPDEQGNMTEAEAESMLRSFSEQKDTSVSFFRDVIKNKDSSKIGNLSEEELGTPQLPVRTLQELGMLSKDVFNRPTFGDYFDKQAEMLLATSLSKYGFLIKQVGTSKKEIADVTPKERKPNGGWFKRKNQQQPVSGY